MKKGNYWLKWLSLLWLFVATNSLANVVRFIGVEQGLHNQVVLSSAEDQDGLLWIGTEDGLYRLSDRVVRRVDLRSQTGPLSNSVYRALQVLPDQRLLVSTAQQMALFDIGQNQFTLLSDRFPILPATSSTAAFYQDQQRLIWFITDQGQLYRLNPGLNELKLVATLPSGQRYRQVLHHSDGTLWVAAPHQLWQLDRQGNIVNENRWSEQLGELVRLLDYDLNTIWATSSTGLMAINTKSTTLPPQSILDVPVRDLQMDPRGNVWLLGRGKLWLWRSGELAPEPQPLPQRSGFDNTLLVKMMLDSKQRIWLLSNYQGIMALRPMVSFVEEIYQQQRFPQMQSESIWHIWADADQRLLASDGGVQWFNRHTGEYRHIPLPGLDESGAAWTVIAQDQQHWLVGSSNGLYRIDRRTFVATALRPAGAEYLAQRSIYLLVDADDSTLIVTDLEAFRWWDDGRIEVISVEGEPLLGIRNLYLDQQQRMWVAGEAILGYFDAKQQYQSLLSRLPSAQRLNSFSMILPISEQRIWFGNFGHGLWQYDVRWNEVAAITEHLGLRCDNPNFATTHLQQVLLGCDRILYRIEPATGEVIGVDRYDGLPLVDFNEGAMFYQPELGFMVGSSSGMAVLDPDKMFVVGRGQHALVESVLLQRKDGSRQQWLRPELSRIEMDAEVQLLTLQFASNRLLDPSPKHFRYRLNVGGVPGDLINLDQGERLTFSHLEPGDYEVELYGSLQGRWQTLPSRVRFTVQQSWWQQPWIQLSGVGGLLLLMLIAMLNLRSRIHQGNRALQQLANSRQKLQSALNAGHSDSWEWRREDGLLHIHDRQKIFSRSGETQQLKVESMVIHPDDRLAVSRAWKQHICGHSDHYNVTYRQTDRKGQWRWIRTNGQVVQRDPVDGQPLVSAGIYTDITHTRRLEEEHSLYALAFEYAAEGVLILDRALTIVSANPAAVKILGCRQGDLHSADFMRFWQHEQSLTVADLMAMPTPWQGEIILFNSKGVPLPMAASVNTMATEPEPRWIILFSDISERKQTELALQRLANFDPLTGLLNRSNFNQKSERLLQQNRLLEQSAALLFLDLDRFKHINDTYGHSAGDALLVEAARRLQQQLSADDLLCRFGGDEFVILVPKLTQVEQLERLAERLLQAISEPFELDTQVFYLTTSVGIACWPEDGDQLESLVKNADLAMYQAKEEGRGRYCFYTKQRNDQASYHLALDGALREALLNERLQVYFQPQLDMDSGKVVGVEALLRWFDVGTGAVAPEEFIAIAESNGFITKLDRWALRQACREFVRWPQSKQLLLSVNVSAIHFRQAGFVDYVAEVLEQTGMAPAQLCIEITEGVLMQQVQLVQRHLHALQQLGVRVAIDDFGTGYSSLAYLSQFAVDQVKIDRSFVLSLPQSATNAAIIQTIVDLGRNLKLEVLAEGVETAAQQAFLQQQGCHLVQGYRFAKPMSADQCQSWLQQWDHTQLLQPTL
ncbi:EAL domain-containing protein [uncultured Ferrimonas sp.]|uniref:EAL domain-containing protein n=1 Tax=uncultured Ferrimonas sp. TaxID=432640 RepID=UPI00262A176A|nr:EAL domain-containing protein [uncultured Ferrimonas sp.]